MNYVRFENTLKDLPDCQTALSLGALDHDELSESELRAAKKLIEICVDIAENYNVVA